MYVAELDYKLEHFSYAQILIFCLVHIKGPLSTGVALNVF